MKQINKQYNIIKSPVDLYFLKEFREEEKKYSAIEHVLTCDNMKNPF